MHSSQYLIYLPPHLLSADAKTLCVRFLTFSKATGFLLPLHTPWGIIKDKTKVVDGNSLDIIFQGFDQKINSFCIGILLSLKCLKNTC